MRYFWSGESEGLVAIVLIDNINYGDGMVISDWGVGNIMGGCHSCFWRVGWSGWGCLLREKR